MITMPLPELEPITFRPQDVVKTFKQFERKVNGYSKTFSDISDIEKYVDKFIREHPEFAKPIRTDELGAKQVKFELTPLIAMFSAPIETMPHELKLIDEFNHVALRPDNAVEGVYYHYVMYVPILDELLNLESEEKLLKEHCSLMEGCIDEEFRQNIYELKPLGIVTRVCGWDGSWIAYSYTIKDDPSVVWGTPLVDSPYKNTQPFVAVKNGEFVILEDDLTPENHARVKDVRTRISNRADKIEGLELKEMEVIHVDTGWVIAHAINTQNIFRGFSLEHAIKDLGQHIPDLTIHEENFKGKELLQVLEEEITEEPIYRFKLENIRKHTIRYDKK